MKKIIPHTVVAIELILTIYLGFIAYIISSWFIDDSVAVTLIDNDWNMIATRRIINFLIIGAIFAISTFFINKHLFSRFAQIKKNKTSIIISTLIFFMIIIPSIIGAIEFATKKPFM